MEILIEDRQDHHRIRHETLKRKAGTILNALECPDGELSLLVVDDTQIAELNETYLNRTGPTNVIAFPMREGLFGQVNQSLLGDVVISTETAAREARAAGLSFEERFDQLLAHGILHLFGYDHENSSAEAARMRRKEKELLALL